MEGSEAAKKKLYEQYAPKMYALCYRYASGPDEAKDFLQEGFIKVFQKLHQFADKGSFEGWMRRVFVSISIGELRKRKKEGFNTDLELAENNLDEKPFSSAHDHNYILEKIQELPTGYRTVFNLYVIEEYSHKEIAQELQISENTSKTQLRKARLMLQSKLEQLKEK